MQRNDNLIFTEPLGIDFKFRKFCFEYFFECYGMSMVMPIVDDVAASYKLFKTYKSHNYIVVSISNSGIRVLPFVNDTLVVEQIKKLDFGMKSVKKYMRDLFDCKYNKLNYYVDDF